jgi:phosphoribosylformylglycinamidine cyclo-ligase
VSTRNPYQAAGVDIEAGNHAATRYAKIARRATRREVLGGIGGFSGGFALNIQKYPQPVLMSGTDGVGTKLKIAFETGRHDTIGIDCVAMCVNDILTSGAEPLFFLDYLAVQSLNVDIAEEIVAGVGAGCEEAGCALVGGETAEMADVYQPGEYDLAGTAVGVVNRDDMVTGRAVEVGDVVIGLASNGVHSNGFSLIRRLVGEQALAWSDELPGWRGSVADELLQPTRIYVKAVQALQAAGLQIHGMAHITGGGLVDNVPRCLPEGTSVRLKRGSWHIQPVFEWLQAQAGTDFVDAARVWNMGIGYVLIVPESLADAAMQTLGAVGETCYRMGEVVPGQQTLEWEA